MDRQRRQLEMLLTRIVVDHGIDFIGEETYPDRETIARLVAGRHNFRWSPIEMSLETRKQLGIAKDQKSRPLPPNETRVSSDAIREDYMVKTALEQSGNARRVLIICGRIHADALVQRFQKAGHAVSKLHFGPEAEGA
jgi:hypothetical protein